MLTITILSFVALVWVVGAAVTSDGLRVVWVQRPWEVLAGAAALCVLVSSSTFVLKVPADFRQSYEAAGCAWLVLWLSTGSRRWWALLIVAPVTAVVLAFRCLVL